MPAANIRIPDDLTERDQWVLWRSEQRGGKPTKVPYQANGKPASSTDPSTWASHEEVAATYREFPKSWSGIGFVFSPDDPYCGVDLDDCLEAGELKPWAQPIIGPFGDTYMEVSPSGHGIKIWCKAKLPGPGKSTKDDDGGIEVYDRGRYFTVTGNVFNGAPAQLEDHQRDVDRMYAMAPGKTTSGTKRGPKADLHDGQPVPEGERYTYLQSAAAQYRAKGMDRDEVYAAIAAINASRCAPPKADFVLQELADWAGSLEPGDYLKNETGNANRLFKRYGENLAHCEQRKGFMVWTGSVWKFDKFVASERMAEETMLAAYSDAGNIPDTKERELFLKFLGVSLSCKGLGNIVHLVKKKLRQVDTTDFDRDPFLLNCNNGTIDLRTGELRPYRKADLLAKLIPIDYDPAAKCPLFLRTLYRIMGDGPDATETEIETARRLVAYLQRLFGCAATGKPEKLLVVFYGSTGDNGKSTLLATIGKALGDQEYGAQINVQSLMVDPKGGAMSNAVNSDLSDLQGCRFVFSSEVERGQRLALSRVKYLTGLTAVKARRLGENWIEFAPTWKIFMDCNDRPVITSPTDAIWNRVKCVPFSVKLSGSEIDTGLPEKLARELPGILAWIVAGALEYVAHGLGPAPPEVAVSTEDYRQTSDRLKEFIEDCCHLNPYAWVISDRLVQAYTEWCAKNGERHPLNLKEFREQITLKGCAPKTNTIHGKKTRGWAGIELEP